MHAEVPLPEEAPSAPPVLGHLDVPGGVLSMGATDDVNAHEAQHGHDGAVLAATFASTRCLWTSSGHEENMLWADSKSCCRTIVREIV